MSTKTRTELDHPMELPCPLTEAEKSQRGERMANLIHERAQIELARKADADEHKAKLAAIDEQVSELALTVRRGYELRAVKCEQVKDYALGRVTVVRCDTGETISEREMTVDERQLGLDAMYGEPDRPSAPAA